MISALIAVVLFLSSLARAEIVAVEAVEKGLYQELSGDVQAVEKGQRALEKKVIGGDYFLIEKFSPELAGIEERVRSSPNAPPGFRVSVFKKNPLAKDRRVAFCVDRHVYVDESLLGHKNLLLVVLAHELGHGRFDLWLRAQILKKFSGELRDEMLSRLETRADRRGMFILFDIKARPDMFLEGLDEARDMGFISAQEAQFRKDQARETLRFLEAQFPQNILLAAR